eukprot:17129-Heterococcus_DN1.PRE.2
MKRQALTLLKCAVIACPSAASWARPDMLACEHVIGKCAESDAVVALFLQRRRASDYLAVSYSNRAALTADRMQRYQAAFKRLDTDCSDAIGPEALADLFKELNVKPLTRYTTLHRTYTCRMLYELTYSIADSAVILCKHGTLPFSKYCYKHMLLVETCAMSVLKAANGISRERSSRRGRSPPASPGFDAPVNDRYTNHRYSVSPTGSLSDYAFGTTAAEYNAGAATPRTAGTAAHRQQLTSFDQFLSMVLDSETARSNSPLNRALRRGSVLVAKVADATKQAA